MARRERFEPIGNATAHKAAEHRRCDLYLQPRRVGGSCRAFSHYRPGDDAGDVVHRSVRHQQHLPRLARLGGCSPARRAATHRAIGRFHEPHLGALSLVTIVALMCSWLSLRAEAVALGKVPCVSATIGGAFNAVAKTDSSRQGIAQLRQTQWCCQYAQCNRRYYTQFVCDLDMTTSYPLS